MRITTQMLNISAIQAGMPVNQVSLLNYINSDSSENSLISALNTNGSSVTNSIKKNNYEKLETASGQLLQKAEILTAQGEESVFTKAKESGNNQEIYDATEALVENYNSTITALRAASAPLNDYYRQMMQEAVTENSEALDCIGISISKDGTMVLDKNKLKDADLDSLEKALGSSGTFLEKITFIASRISDNAKANVENLTSQYNSSGSTYSALTSKYNFWG